jgi:excinuclease ABC subunit A
MRSDNEWIRIRGARTHNLHNANLDLPRGDLIVVTGPSGSGKSSLAFDTIYAEGRRRYLATLRDPAGRALLEQMGRPDVDRIEGLPPVLSVAQNVGTPRPRATLGTLTEIQDHLRLLWARLGIPYCPVCDLPIRKHTAAEIVREILQLPEGTKIYLLAPLVRGQKGDHAEVFRSILKGGFLRARVDGVLQEIRDVPKIDARKTHDIDLVVDRLVVRPTLADRLHESLTTALQWGQGRLFVSDAEEGDWIDRPFMTRFACPRCERPFPDLEPRLFHFDSPHGACPRCTGLGQIWSLDPQRLLADRTKTLGQTLARLQDLAPQTELLDRRELQALQATFPDMKLDKAALAEWPAAAIEMLLEGNASHQVRGLAPTFRELAKQAEEDEELRNQLEPLAGFVVCPDCHGTRLRLEARWVRFEDKGIHEVTARTVDDAEPFFAAALQQSTDRVRTALVGEIASRLRFLREVGLGYVTLDRPAVTLSGGELQRARIATQLGGGLLGVCCILDEPTAGLHPRDTARLLAALRRLQEHGNTLLVVEHDEAVMREADWLVDVGPGAGKGGGRILASGRPDEVLTNPDSVTAPYLRGDMESAVRARISVTGETPALVLRRVRHRNLKNIDVAIPLGRLVAIAGVSGSGKSSLVREVLAPAVRRKLGMLAPPPGEFDAFVETSLSTCLDASSDSIDKAQSRQDNNLVATADRFSFDKIIEVDQKPLGRSPRSSAATFTGVFDEIRKLYAQTKLARIRGYKPPRFSFNVKGGRCEECKGQGEIRSAASFLPELSLPCPVCRGKRFNDATLEITYHGQSIADVLDMPIGEARAFFANVPTIARVLAALDDVGLGYLGLGQPATQLSGGEAQRVKLAAELARTTTGRTLLILDEPTSGLHRRDIAELIRVLDALVAAGNTVLVVEHHLDMLKAADWVIELGPEAGAAGGHLVATGAAEDLANTPASPTGRFLHAEPRQ